MNIAEYMQRIGQQARSSARPLASSTTLHKNAGLQAIAQYLNDQQDQVLAANAEDMRAAEAEHLDSALLDRLELTPARYEDMLDGLQQVIDLPDPIGEILGMRYRPSGIQLGQMRVPLGVVGIIYESRPNVTLEAAALCLKSGNAAILRGGSESLRSNQALARAIHAGLQSSGLPLHAVQVLETRDRAAVGRLVSMPEYVDVIVPRGGKGLIERVSAEAKVPVIKHLDGICHVYIHADADLDMALRIAMNAKTHRYGVCNAMETLLIDSKLAASMLDRLVPAMQSQGVELRGCPRCLELCPNAMIPATEDDWRTEYLAPILSLRIVDHVDAAMDHIDTYGSHHTDAIVTNNLDIARRFINEVDSSSVMVNASTRFADGFEYGLGAEIGISTDKFHARGPVGLEGLTSLKWIVLGNGQIRGG